MYYTSFFSENEREKKLGSLENKWKNLCDVSDRILKKSEIGATYGIHFWY